MDGAAESWLALDVGGANLKASHSTGGDRSFPFALWRDPTGLGRTLARFLATFPPADRVALTMTAELCDCYRTKSEGVLAVLDAVSAALPGLSVSVWGIDGRLRTVDEVRADPRVAAAANWLALATVAAALIGAEEGILVDIGSTTSDLIPLRGGRAVPVGRTDTERLQSGGLVYVGVRRTPLCAGATSLPFRGRATDLAAEVFATTRDVFLMLGEVAEDPADCDTADGRPATREFARNRLARAVGADREGCSLEDATRLAEAAREAILARLVSAAGRARGSETGRPTVAVVAGSGEFLACRLASRLLPRGGRIVRLSEVWGPDASAAACAHALRRIASGYGIAWEEHE